MKVIAVSIDDSRNGPKVAPFANGKDWPFEIYIDANSDLKRALNVNTIPHTFLLNADKEIVWQTPLILMVMRKNYMKKS